MVFLFSQRVLNQTVALVCVMIHFILAVCFVLSTFFYGNLANVTLQGAMIVQFAYFNIL